MVSSDGNSQGIRQSLPWYRDAGIVLAAGRNVGRALIAALVCWALAAGTWRALRAVVGEGKPLSVQALDLGVQFWGGALLFAFAAAAAAVLIVLVSGLIGGALGFLFALPRMEVRGSASTQEVSNGGSQREGASGATPLQGNSGSPRKDAFGATPSSDNASMFRPSPALNEIADWLTKIIVGLGLVQSTAIGQGFRDVMVFMLGTGGLGRFPVAGVVVPACMLIGLTGGFIAVYLAMTLAVSPEIARAAFVLETQRERQAVQERDEARNAQLTAELAAQRAEEREAAAKRATDEAEQAAVQADKVARARAQIVNKWRRVEVQDLVNPAYGERNVTLSQEERDFADQPLNEFRNIDERRALAKLNIAIGRTSAALEIYTAMLADADIYIATEGHTLAVAYRQPALITRFADRLQELRDRQPSSVSPALNEIFELDRVNAALYDDKPSGFEKATKLLHDLASALPTVLDNGAYHVYRAAALGQRYTYLLTNGTLDAAATAAIVKEAVPEIIRARDLGQGYWLTYLAKSDLLAKFGVPEKQRDDDLVDLAKLPEVRQALGLS